MRFAFWFEASAHTSPAGDSLGDSARHSDASPLGWSAGAAEIMELLKEPKDTMNFGEGWHSDPDVLRAAFYGDLPLRQGVAARGW